MLYYCVSESENECHSPMRWPSKWNRSEWHTNIISPFLVPLLRITLAFWNWPPEFLFISLAIVSFATEFQIMLCPGDLVVLMQNFKERFIFHMPNAASIPTRTTEEGFWLLIYRILWRDNLCFYAEGSTDNAGLFLEVVHRSPLFRRVDFPTVSSQQSQDVLPVGAPCLWPVHGWDNFLWKSFPCQALLHQPSYMVFYSKEGAVHHPFFFFFWLHHTVCPLEAGNTFLAF